MTDRTPPKNSRREFLKSSTAVALGSGLLAGFDASRAFASGDDTIRVGLIGCGGRGGKATVQALSTAGPVKLVALADAFEDRLEAKDREIRAALGDRAKERYAVDNDHKFVGFDAYRQLIDSGVDLVILATPPGFRPIHFEAAIQAGKHVFMEKPVAVDAPGVRQVLAAGELATKKNLKVGVGLQRRHQANYRETIKRIHDGALGDVIALRVYWNGGGVWEPRRRRDQVRSEMEYQMRNWYYYTWLCGDHIVEQHIHNLDVGNWIKGEYPVRAQGVAGRQVRTDKRYGEIYDHFGIEFEFADGSRMFSECRHIRNCWNSVSEHAHGSKGMLDISSRGNARILGPDGKTLWEFRQRRSERKDPYQVEHDDLFAAIRQDTPYNEAEYGAMSTMTAILGRMAGYSGQMISMKDALNSNRSLMPERFAWDANPPTLPNEKGEYPIPMPGVTKVL